MKMKKLIAALLACVMLCAVAAPAIGETCYDFLKTYLSDKSLNESAYGTPITTDVDKNDLVFLYYMGDGCLYLSGINNRNKGEACMWFNLDATDVLILFYVLSSRWDAISGLCDSGYRLCMAYGFNDDDAYFIDSAYTAAEFVSTVDRIIN